MENVVKGNFRNTNQVSHVEYTEHLTLRHLEQYTKSINLMTLHVMVLRYRTKQGAALDPNGDKLRASANMYRLLVLSGEEKIGVSPLFAGELLKDIEFLRKMEENNEIDETNEGEK